MKAVVAVDYAGRPCEWRELQALAQEYEFQLVDDACHALGAQYEGIEICSSKFADAVICSFHPVKHITTGEGGAVFTNNPELDQKIKRLRTHGTTKDENLLEQNHGPWYYEMVDLGFNYRITDLQCALGVSQLGKLDRFLARRREIARYYDEVFMPFEHIVTPAVHKDVTHAYHIYPLQIDFDVLRIDKTIFFSQLREAGIIAQVHYIPVHLQPYYKKHFGFKADDFPNAEGFYKNEISIPIYPLLTAEDLAYISETIIRLVNHR